MNEIDFVVESVVSDPLYEYGKWWVSVIAESYGRSSVMKIMCNTLDEAKQNDIGYEFLG